VCIISGALCIRQQIEDNEPLDGTVLGIIALGAFFGLFTFGMTATSLRYIFINLTNVDVLRQKSIVYQLAIRVPHGTPPGPDYGIVVYPLPRPEGRRQSRQEPVSSRDRLAQHTFAVVRTEMGENPWNLGLYKNWVSVMGNNPLDWVLPLRMSPCVFYENERSFYEIGPLYNTLRRRYRLPRLPRDGKNGVELGDISQTST
jgi:palmitoyltransferase